MSDEAAALLEEKRAWRECWRDELLELERVRARRLWAALMLARSLEVFESVCAGRPVLMRLLDPAAVRRALRGAWARGEYLTLDGAMLDAVAEGGAFA